MAAITLSLSEDRLAFVDEEIASGKFRSASELVEALILAEQLRANQNAIDDLLLEAEDELDELVIDSAELREKTRQELEEFIRLERSK